MTFLKVLPPLFLTLVPSSLFSAMIVLKEGVSPTAGYTSGGVTIRSDQPTTNQQVGAGNIVLGNITTGADLRAVFSFDLSAIGAIGSATINSVTFSWTGAADSSASSVLQIDLFRLTQSFTETGVTWNSRNGTNLWTTPGGDFSGTLLSSQSGNPNTGTSSGNPLWTFASSANFISAAQSAFDSGGQTLYFIAKLNDETGLTRRIFQILGDENATTGSRPSLTVNYTAVPEPGIVALFAIAAGTVLFRRRRIYKG